VAFAQAGFDVAISFSRSERDAHETASEVQAVGRRACVVQADVAEDAAVRRMVDQVVADLGGLNVLVNNAGTTRYSPLNDLDSVTDEVWQAILGVNVLGPFHCIRAALPHLRRSGRGKVVNTASTSAFRPTGSSVPYMASKAALVSMTRSLARGLAPDIQVNAVAPGWMATRWIDEHVPADVRERVVEGVPMASLEDVASTILFLATTDSITGEVVTVDRGVNL
jgi:3-oxoacyl-[acyl-carrier protein] reductase